MEFLYMGVVSVGLGIITLLFTWRFLFNQKRAQSNPPAIPGLPLIGNLHQLKEKKPHQTFAKWADIYGPIYSIRTGASTVVVLNSIDLAKEAMVTRFASISTRKLSSALMLLTSNKKMVAMSDYGDFHRTVKRFILTSVLGANAQKRLRNNRETMIENCLRKFYAEFNHNPTQAVNFRDIFKAELFHLALKQALGKIIESIYVEELGVILSKQEVFNILVIDPMMGAIEVDWRDFFPYLRWVPNKKVEEKIHQMAFRKYVVTKALIHEQKKRIDAGEALESYVDFLLAQGDALTEEQLTMLVWEAIIETSDTTLITSEWAMYELCKNPQCQERLFREIQEVCGDENLTEDHLPSLPYLSAVFHETLRRHSPVPIVPLRYAHENTQLGGYHIQSGTEIAINLYGCNMDKKQWEDPESWKPERFMEEKTNSMDLFKTMAFGGGKRVCAGALQAMFIACTSIGRFVQDFTWKLEKGEEEKVDTLQLTSHKLEPLKAIIKPRRNRSLAA